MDSQLCFLTDAIEHLQQAHEAIENLNLEQAKEELTIAREIDPYISTLDTTAKLIALFEKHLEECGEVEDFLAQVWQFVPQACQQNKLFLNEAKLADKYLVKIAEKQLPPDSDFIDPDEILHWGSLYLVAGKYEQARKVLLQTLSSTHPLRADLWAYYGDVCMESKKSNEAMAAYLNAVVIDPQEMDLFRIRNKDISALFAALQKSHPEAEARALLLFHGWLNGLFKIPPRFGKFFAEHQAFQTLLDEELPNDKAARIHRFSICLCRDQSQSGDGPHDYSFRERMLELDAELFAQYMKKLGR